MPTECEHGRIVDWGDFGENNVGIVTDPPGCELCAAKLQVQKRLHAAGDAQVWAQEFMAEFGNRREDIDEGLMIGWFANAMETALVRQQAEFNALMEAYEGLADQLVIAWKS